MKIPEKRYKSTYFTIKCTHSEVQSDGTNKEFYDYFSIHTYKEGEIIKIREGYKVRCFVRRDSRLWIKNNDFVFKFDRRGPEGNKENYGKYPIIFSNYELVSKIDILDDSTDQEALSTTNRDFEYFMGRFF